MRSALVTTNSILARNVQKVSEQIRQETRRLVHSAEKKLANDLYTAQYCLHLVEKNDRENYLCTLLLSGEERRRHAFALRAFNVEVSKCAANVSSETIAKMRLKFWHDSVDKCLDTNTPSYVADHPVLRELRNTATCHRAPLSKVYLKRLVSVRDRPPNQQFLTLKQLEDYAEQSCGSVLHLLVQLCGVKDLQVDHAASHLGKAQGIATLLRAIPYKGRGEALNIPQETLIKHGVSQERVMRQKDGDKGVEECVFEVATAAHQHLEMARSLMDKVPKEVRQLFLPAVAVARYLDRLRCANFCLTHPNCLQRDALLPLSLYWHRLRGAY